MNVAVIGLVGLRKMGRKTWVDGDGMKKGEWTAEEDQNLVAYINEHGVSDWRSLPKRAGLQRCGKSCRLRWLNYLRPGIKRGKFTPQEEEEIIKLHAVLGNRSYNGGEDDEVAAMAAVSYEEIRGEAIREEIRRVGSGEGTGEGEIDGGDSLERAQGDVYS